MCFKRLVLNVRKINYKLVLNVRHLIIRRGSKNLYYFDLICCNIIYREKDVQNDTQQVEKHHKLSYTQTI